MNEVIKRVRGWVEIAVGSLLLGGVLSLVLLVGRAPVINRVITDPMFAKRILVVHVNFMLSCWFMSFAAALFQWVLVRPFFPRMSRHLTFGGAIMMVAAGFFPSATPVLSNYVPVLNHPLYLMGLGMFSLGVIAACVGKISWKNVTSNTTDELISENVRVGILASTLLLVSSFVILLVTAFRLKFTPQDPHAYYEALFWGAGHLFQYTNAAIAMTVWIYLLERLYGVGVLSVRLVLISFLGLILTIGPAVLIATGGGNYFNDFELTMRWMSWPGAVLILLVSLRILFSRSMGSTSDPYAFMLRNGLMASQALMVLGFILGSMIRGSTTLIPAHYHATTGAVTIALMTVTYAWSAHLGLVWKTGAPGKWAQRQSLLYGTGQVVFVIGYTLAGIYGAARKTYGGEQALRTIQEKVGLGLAGLGGVIAVISGGIFLWTIINARRNSDCVSQN